MQFSIGVAEFGSLQTVERKEKLELGKTQVSALAHALLIHSREIQTYFADHQNERQSRTSNRSEDRFLEKEVRHGTDTSN